MVLSDPAGKGPELTLDIFHAMIGSTVDDGLIAEKAAMGTAFKGNKKGNDQSLSSYKKNPP